MLPTETSERSFSSSFVISAAAEAVERDTWNVGLESKTEEAAGEVTRRSGSTNWAARDGGSPAPEA